MVRILSCLVWMFSGKEYSPPDSLLQFQNRLFFYEKRLKNGKKGETAT